MSGESMTAWERINSLPLRYKLALGIMICGLVTIGLALYASIQYSQALPATASVMIRQLSQERLDALNRTINITAAKTARLANDAVNVGRYATLNGNANDEAARQQTSEAFRLLLNAEPTFRQIRFVSLDGKRLISVPGVTAGDETNEEYYRALKDRLPTRQSNDVYVSKMVQQPIPSIEFAAVPVVNDKPVGFVVITLDVTGSADPSAQSIYTALRSVDTPTGRVSFYLLDKTGKIISSTGQPIAGTDTSNAAQQLFSSNGAPGQYISPLTGELALGRATVPLSRQNLVLVSEITLSKGGQLAETTGYLLPLLGLLIAGMVLIGAVGFWLDGAMVRPAENLVEIANQIAQGRYKEPLKPMGQRDEFGRLYNAFSVLAGRLREDTGQLEEFVVQRTNDLLAAQEIGQTLLSVRDVDRLLADAATTIQSRFNDVTHVQIYLADARREYATLRASTTGDTAIKVKRVLINNPNSRNLIGKAAQDSTAVVALDTQPNKPEFLPGCRAELAVPLMYNGAAIGVLDVQSQNLRAFTQSEIAVFQAIAVQLTTAIQNAQQFEELANRLRELETANRQLAGEAWRDYVGTRQSSPEAGNVWSQTQRQAVETGDIAESILPDAVTFAVPITLRGQVLGAVEWDVPRSSYNENIRQLARELAARFAISADNTRLFEQTQRIAQRERLVNEIAGKLIQQTDVTEILKVAVKEVGQALRVPQTSIRLAITPDDEGRGGSQ